MKRLLLSIIYTIFAASVMAQTSAITGVVISQDSIPMVGAMVAVNQGVLYTSCDQSGVFYIGQIPRGKITVDISFVGYTPVKKEIQLGIKTVDLGLVILNEIQNDIEQVQVIGHSPLAVQKGDTTQYNAAAYKTNPDADVGSLLEKLPGVIITDDKIEAQGETIKRVYIDGKLFFGNDVASALKNLPADAVESIQIFDDMSDIAKMTGIDDGEREKTINLVTKSRRSTNTLGRFEVSGGQSTEAPHKNRYLVGGNLTHFGKTSRLTITGVLNNINLSSFGIATDGESAEDLEDLSSQPNGEMKIGSLGVNFNRDTKSTKTALSYFFDDRSSHLSNIGESIYFPSARYDSRSTFHNNLSSGHYTAHRFDGRIQKILNRKNILLFTPRIIYRRNDAAGDYHSLIIQNGDSLTNTHTNLSTLTDYLQVYGQLMWTHRFEKRGRRISAHVTTNITRNGQERYNRELLHERYNVSQGIWKPQSSTSNRHITQDAGNNVLIATLTYVEPFKTNKHRLVLNLTGQYEWSSTDKTGYDYNKTTELYDKINRSQSNIFERNYKTISGRVGYSFIPHQNLNFGAGIDVKKIWQFKEETLPTQYTGSYSFDELSPYITLRYNKGKTRHIRLNYRGRNILPNINQMQNVINDASKSNLKVGNPNLKQGYTHTLTFFYTSSNLKKSTSFTTSLTGETRSNYIANSVIVLPEDTVLADYGNYVSEYPDAFLNIPINLDGYKYLKLTTTYSFHLRPLRSNVNTSFSYKLSRVPSFYQLLNYATTSEYDFRVGLSSNISENVDFNLYSQTKYTNIINSERKDDLYVRQNLFASVNIILFRRLVLNTVSALKYYKSTAVDGYNDTYYPINVGIGYKFFKSRQAEFRITVYDLFNQNTNVRHTVSSTYIQDATITALGRYALARISYRFNTMTNPPMSRKEIAKAMNLTAADSKGAKAKAKKKKTNNNKKAAQKK